jgi:hypothetical protein
MSTGQFADGGTTVKLVVRPEGQLQNLPFEYRWEVTRRHGYYQIWWKTARSYFRGQPAAPLYRPELGAIGAAILRSIGVIGDAPDPATDFANLFDPPVGSLYLGDTIQPLTLRHMVRLLIEQLPTGERWLVGALFAHSSDAKKNDSVEPATDRQREAVARLGQAASPALDSFPAAPLFYLHAGASQRAIVRDVERYASNWKKRRNIPEHRIRPEKFRSYLQAWDLKEGWSGGRYDRSRELTFAEVASRLRTTISTVANRYRSAFKLITGHEFRPEIWSLTFGGLYFATLVNRQDSGKHRRPKHHLQSPSRRPTPDSVVTPERRRGRGEGLVENLTTHRGDFELVDLVHDVGVLIRRGKNDDQIAAELELPEDGRSMISAMRERLDEYTIAGLTEE